MTPILIMIIDYLEKYNLCGYIINTSDAHNNEYIGPSDMRLQQVSKFTGSNGLLFINKTEKYLWTDGRYHIQAENELDKDIVLVKEKEDFDKIISKYKKVGLNMKHFSTAEFKSLKAASKDTDFFHLEVEGAYSLVDKTFNNLINLEEIKLSSYFNKTHIALVNNHYKWFDADQINLESNVTGSVRQEKIDKVRVNLKDNELIIFTLLDEIAWILNLRGNDIEYNPVFYSYLIVTKQTIKLFIGCEMDIEGVETCDYNDFYEHCSQITQNNVLISGDCNQFLFDKLSGENQVKFDDTVRKMKSVKNAHEIFGFIMAHVYDSIALTILFEWIQETLKTSKLTELEISNQLLKIKKSKFKGFFSPSFATISATSDNSAIIHHVGSDRTVEKDDLYLIDSGSQYYFGTTDVTRTLKFSTPTVQEKNDFTYVLMGQIDAICAVFNKKYNASLLDVITRLHIWKNSTVDDFEHSTGHGVGHFLNVHEAPPSISRYGKLLEENMIFSIEPGLYKKGEYGIRIEDLVITRTYGNAKFKLHNLTLAPLQMKMINFELLGEVHKEYIRVFNERVRSVLGSFIESGDVGYSFMVENTEF